MDAQIAPVIREGGLHRSRNLELHIVDHCNLTCVGCSHESPLMAARAEKPERLGEALTALWRHYRAPLLKLLGGEPLLHPALPDIIAVARSVTDARIRVVTNGLLLQNRTPQLKGVDEIHISSYPGIRIPDIEGLRAVSAATGATVTVEHFERFRWHREPNRADQELTRRIFRTCQMYNGWQCHTLREGRFYPCPPAGTWGAGDTDGVELLLDAGTLAHRLSAVLGRQEPLATCASCLGSTGTVFNHHRGWKPQAGALVGAGVDTVFLERLEGDADAWNDCYVYKYTVSPSGQVEGHDGIQLT